MFLFEYNMCSDCSTKHCSFGILVSVRPSNCFVSSSNFSCVSVNMSFYLSYILLGLPLSKSGNQQTTCRPFSDISKLIDDLIARREWEMDMRVEHFVLIGNLKAT